MPPGCVSVALIMSAPAKPPLIVIAGATASGKSALAMDLAAREGGTIVNADAMQVYADLRVLTARPSSAEEAVVPHRLYGVRDAARPCSAADWAVLAKAAIAEAHAGGRVSIVVGGTGLYLRTLLDGIAPVPAIDTLVRAEVRALSTDAACAALAREDAAAAAKLMPTDTQRIARALEVVRSTAKPLAQWQRAREGGVTAEVELRAMVVEVDPELLRARIFMRAAAMLAGGAIEEVRALLARHLDPALPAMKAVGVREIARLLAGEIDGAETAARIGFETARYAKRQRTWLRNQCADWARVVL